MEKREVTICGTCKGQGYTTRLGRGPDGDGDPREWGLMTLKSECSDCEGSGRLLKITSYKPFKPEA